MNKTDRIEILKKLVDDKAIEFINANEKEYKEQYDEFIKINGKPYVIGIDLANGPDQTAYAPLSKHEA